MSRKKPALKRSLLGSGPRRSSHPAAFILALALIVFLSFILVKIIKAPKKEPSAQKPSAVQTMKRNSAPKTAVQSKPRTSAAATPDFPKDSHTYPDQAPRFEHKKPAAVPPPASGRKIDWNRPVIVFVIDDIGHEMTYDKVMDVLGDRITYAILPYVKYSTFYAEKSRQTGADVILHLPLESELGIYPGPGLITSRMPEEEIRRMVNEELNSIPNHIGANNHMGSLGTSDARFMTIVLQEFKKRKLFFLDSYTSGNSQVVPVCRKMRIPVLRRDVFLDNDESPQAVLAQIRRTAMVAQKTGFAIAIGHYKKYTLQTIAQEIPKLEAEGFQIVKLSDLMRRYN